MEASEPKWVNSETVLIKWVYSDCILDTISDLKDLEWYLWNKPNNFIGFNKNWLRVNTFKIGVNMVYSYRTPGYKFISIKKSKNYCLLLMYFQYDQSLQLQPYVRCPYLSRLKRILL